MLLKTQDPAMVSPPGRDALETARRRRAPRFVIVDEHGATAMTPNDPDAGNPPIDLSPALALTLIRELDAGTDSEVFALVGPTTVVRATSLSGSIGRFYAMFVEHVESRDLLANASDKYALSSREIDVLRLVLHGLSTAEIAEQLCIAATTVHAHVKNIARKTKSTKRTEILAKLLGVR